MSKFFFFDFSDFRDFSNFWKEMKKKIIYNEKRKFFLVQNLKWATAHLSRRLGAGQAQGARGACVGSAGARWAGALGARRQARQACVGAGRGAQAGARAGAGRRQQRASAAGAWACTAAGRRRRRAAGRWARGRALGARQAGRWAHDRQVLGARQAGAGRAGRARPGRLGWPWAVHSAHFRSVLTIFFLSHQMNTVHCEIIFFF